MREWRANQVSHKGNTIAIAPMVIPLLIAAASVAGGAFLGLVGRRGYASSLATFALVSALAVVLSQLLPDALAGAGLAALLVFGAGAMLPTLIEKLAMARLDAGAAHRVGLELGYAGLLLHKVGDGLGLGTYGGEHHAGHGHFDVLLAIAAHTVPMVALVTLAFRRIQGPKLAVLRALGLGLATLLGVVLPTLVPVALFHQAEPWVTAGVAGLLLHVLAHDWQPEASPNHAGRRLIDALAVLAALGLVFFGGHEHAEGGSHVRHEMSEALAELAVETAPALLLGLVIGALLSTLGRRLSTTWLQGGGALWQAFRGAIVGAPLPICACGVLPLASSLRRRGAGPALVVAFLLATPELGIETLVLTAHFVGWPFAIVRLVAAVLLAVIAALVFHRLFGGGAAELEEEEAEVVNEEGPFLPRFVASFDELLYHVAPWTLVGLVAAAYVQAVLPADALGSLGPLGLDVLVVTLIAVPSYVCAASATPLAAVLLLKGMSPGAVLVGLLLGPATNLATVGFLRKSYGTRATLIGLGVTVVAAWLMAAGLNMVEVPITIEVAAVEDHEHGPISLIAAALLTAALARSIWHLGLRAWLGSLGEALGSDHGHHHHGHHHHGHHHHGHHHHGHDHDPAQNAHGHDAHEHPGHAVEVGEGGRPNDVDPEGM
ncbi:MAG: permease [Sandaracinaceae bacterium]